MKDINPKDSNNKLHGYQQWYSFYWLLSFRGNVIHGNLKGYNEYHELFKATRFYIK
jgi:hypothetical protein